MAEKNNKLAKLLRDIVSYVKSNHVKSLVLLLFICLSLYLKISEANVGLDDEFPGSDPWAYDINAKQFLKGEAPINPLFNPLETIYLSIVYFFFGPNHMIARYIQIIFSFLIALFLYNFTKRFFGETAGYLAALMSLVHPWIVFYSAHLWTEFWLIFLLSLMLYWYALLVKRKSSWKNWLFFGVVSAIASLSKAWALAFPAVLITFMIYYENNKKINFVFLKRWLIASIVCVAGAAIIIAPWSIYATKTQGYPVLINANSGLNFYLGNNPKPMIWMTSDYNWEYLYSVDLPEGNCGELLNKSAGTNFEVYYRNKCGSKYSTNYILHNPSKFISKIWKFTWGYWLFPNLQAFQRLIKAPTSLLIQQWFFWIFMVIGIIISIKKWKVFLPFYLLALIIWFSFAITVYLARYKAGVTPLEILFAAGGLAVTLSVISQLLKSR